MTPSLSELGGIGRQAAQAGRWAEVAACARAILDRNPAAAEGHFLQGLADKAARRPEVAAAAFERALLLDDGRYDAAIERALLLAGLQQHAQAWALIERYRSHLCNSPLYLNMAGSVCTMLGLHEAAWQLQRQACERQPGVDRFQSDLAAACVNVGRIDEARALYQALLERAPGHQRHHYQLSRLGRAGDARHVEQMQRVLAGNGLPPERNIFLYYAIGKELEDLGRWDEAFRHFRMAGDTITAMARYDVGEDVALMDAIIGTCTADWMAAGPVAAEAAKTPIFIVGLPRTGTTLTERIVSSHSQVASLDETRYLPLALRQAGGTGAAGAMMPAVITAAASADSERIARAYLDAAGFRFGPEPFFIDKLPENVLYLGFIARAFPRARLLHLRRHPMDACFAMYKQSYFKFAFSLDNVARYYVAYARLMAHWRQVLGERLIEVDYEALVGDPEEQTRTLLERLGLEFEPACLEFERNAAPSATASAAQVREKVHSRSVGRWRHFAAQLEPLRAALERAGIDVRAD